MTPPFPVPLMFTSWTFHSDGGSAVGNILHRTGLLKAKTVAVDLSIAELTAQHVKDLKDNGLFVVGWGVPGAATGQQLSDLGVQGWMPQIEGDGQRDTVIAALKAGVGSALPRAVVTTYGGLDTAAKVQALKDAGLDRAFVECYKADDPIHADLDRMLAQGGVYGFDPGKLWPLVGTWQGELPDAYSGLASRVPNYGVYLGEPMSDTQLSAYGVLAPAPPAPVPSPTDLNAQIVELCDSWLSRQTGQQTKSRLRNIRRIAASAGNDTGWLSAQPGVTQALDNAHL